MIIIIIIIIIILCSNKWIRGGFTKTSIINFMDYLQRKRKKNQINLQTGKFLINMPLQLLN